MTDTKSGKSKGGVRARFNIIDFLIVLAVIAVLVGVGLRYDIADKIGIMANRDTVEISFLIQEIKETSAEALVIGDIFYWKANGVEIGELLSKTVTDAEAFVENKNGELVKVYNDYNCDVRGVIRAKGIMKEEGFMLGGTQFIAPGKKLYVQSRHLMVTIEITSMTAVTQ